MPRYFFDVLSMVYPDDDGIMLSDRKAIQREATQFIRELLADDHINETLGSDWVLEVRDESGADVLRVEVKNGEPDFPGNARSPVAVNFASRRMVDE